MYIAIIPLTSRTVAAMSLEMSGSGSSLKKAFSVLLMAVSHRSRLATSSWQSAIQCIATYTHSGIHTC